MVNNFACDSTSVSSLLIQTQAVLLLQIWRQHQSNLSALEDAAITKNSARARYRRMQLRYVQFLAQEPRHKNRRIWTG